MMHQENSDLVPQKLLRIHVVFVFHHGSKRKRTGLDGENASNGLARHASELADVKIAAKLIVKHCGKSARIGQSVNNLFDYRLSLCELNSARSSHISKI